MLENLKIEETKYTPEIFLDTAGTMFLKGKSYPENTFEFYAPVMKWLEAYFNTDRRCKMVVTMEIIYFNSSSSKLFFDMFDLLEEASAQHEVEINWIYDAQNESALEAGEDFKDDFQDLKINLVAK